jgi:hypothetical protein
VRRLLLATLLAAPAAPDEVVLRGGGRLSGEVLSETGAFVEISMPNGTMRVPRSRVLEIVREGRGDWLAREAARSLSGGSAGEAVELYGRALAEAPRDEGLRHGLEEALLAHARALLADFRLDEARAALARVDAGNPEARRILDGIAAEERAALESFRDAVRAIDRGDFEAGLRTLEAWRLRRPPGDEAARRAMADAYLAAAEKALADGLARAALDHYRAAASLGAGDRADEPLRMLRPVAVLEALKLGETAEARRLIDSISTTYPDPAVPLFLEAVLSHVRGDVDAAVRDYAESARLAEKRGRPERGLPYDIVRAYAQVTLRSAVARPPQEGVTRWRETFLRPLERAQSLHFEVYAPTRREAEELGRAADGIYAAIAEDLLGAVPQAPRAEIVLHASRQAYLAADQVPDNSPWAAVFLAREQTGGVCYDTLDGENDALVRVELFAGCDGLLADVLPHELAHVVQRRGLPCFRRSHWLDEAVAMMYESEASRRRRLERLAAAEPMPLATLLTLRSTPPDKAQLFYDQAFAHALSIKTGDPTAWRLLLQ